jgi:hypothetical protein
MRWRKNLKLLSGYQGMAKLPRKICLQGTTGAKLWITSLNSHFRRQKGQHKMLRRKKTEPRTPHFLSLNQDIVAGSQGGKCGLKYVI